MTKGAHRRLPAKSSSQRVQNWKAAALQILENIVRQCVAPQYSTKGLLWRWQELPGPWITALHPEPYYHPILCVFQVLKRAKDSTESKVWVACCLRGTGRSYVQPKWGHQNLCKKQGCQPILRKHPGRDLSLPPDLMRLFLRRKEKQINMNTFLGIVLGLGGCQNFVYVFCGGHSIWGRKAHKQNPHKIPGQSSENVVYVFFLRLVFHSQISEEENPHRKNSTQKIKIIRASLFWTASAGFLTHVNGKQAEVREKYSEKFVRTRCSFWCFWASGAKRWNVAIPPSKRNTAKCFALSCRLYAELATNLRFETATLFGDCVLVGRLLVGHLLLDLR